MRLCDDKELFNNLLREISNKENILPEYIEKDYYAISILKELINRNNDFVFKGGTSLSVCQKIINRFSEDIDISYAFETITVGKRKEIKKIFFEAIEATSLTVSNPENIRSRRVFNRYLCPYKSICANRDDQVIVEWATQTPSFPIEEKTAQTIIGKYLQDNGYEDLVEQYNLEPFVVKTITKERTLVDKTFAICDYHISKKLDRQSRHIYDIYHLLKYVKLDSELLELFYRVKQYRLGLETCLSVQGDTPISKYLYELVEQDTYLQDYRQKTAVLTYDKVSYKDCVNSILLIADFLSKNNF